MKIVLDFEYIIIYKSTRNDRRCFLTKSNFFKDEIEIKQIVDKIIFFQPTLDSFNKVLKIKRDLNGWLRFSLKSNFPIGTYKFDIDKSNEDQKVIYKNETI